ncbi:YoaK family protein [Parafrankia discariae]|uniref:YoaK family protein n=1 Tax=Parafrankia discariae TaxID=365528 RepID=UPI00035F89DF|nr:YoaK family protein [Parafrankia discariae]
MPSASERATGSERRTVALLLVMAALTGLVDSLTFLGLGEVFVANMTGNVVVLGFSLAGATGISGILSLNALGCFVLGALAGGRVGARLGRRPRLWLAAVTAAQAVLVAVALAVAARWLGDVLELAVTAGGRSDRDHPGGAEYAIVSTLAVAMGLQHATAQHLARPEIPTNVLTTTITTFAVRTRLGGGRGSGGPRQLVGPAVMFASAGAGALGFLRVTPLLPLYAGLTLVALNLGLTIAGSVFSPRPDRPVSRPPDPPDLSDPSDQTDTPDQPG